MVERAAKRERPTIPACRFARERLHSPSAAGDAQARYAVGEAPLSYDAAYESGRYALGSAGRVFSDHDSTAEADASRASGTRPLAMDYELTHPVSLQRSQAPGEPSAAEPVNEPGATTAQTRPDGLQPRGAAHGHSELEFDALDDSATWALLTIPGAVRTG